MLAIESIQKQIDKEKNIIKILNNAGVNLQENLSLIFLLLQQDSNPEAIEKYYKGLEAHYERERQQAEALWGGDEEDGLEEDYSGLLKHDSDNFAIKLCSILDEKIKHHIDTKEDYEKFLTSPILDQLNEKSKSDLILYLLDKVTQAGRSPIETADASNILYINLYDKEKVKIDGRLRTTHLKANEDIHVLIKELSSSNGVLPLGAFQVLLDQAKIARERAFNNTQHLSPRELENLHQQSIQEQGLLLKLMFLDSGRKNMIFADEADYNVEIMFNKMLELLKENPQKDQQLLFNNFFSHILSSYQSIHGNHDWYNISDDPVLSNSSQNIHIGGRARMSPAFLNIFVKCLLHDLKNPDNTLLSESQREQLSVMLSDEDIKEHRRDEARYYISAYIVEKKIRSVLSLLLSLKAVSTPEDAHKIVVQSYETLSNLAVDNDICNNTELSIIVSKLINEILSPVLENRLGEDVKGSTLVDKLANLCCPESIEKPKWLQRVQNANEHARRNNPFHFVASLEIFKIVNSSAIEKFAALVGNDNAYQFLSAKAITSLTSTKQFLNKINLFPIQNADSREIFRLIFEKNKTILIDKVNKTNAEEIIFDKVLLILSSIETGKIEINEPLKKQILDYFREYAKPESILKFDDLAGQCAQFSFDISAQLFAKIGVKGDFKKIPDEYLLKILSAYQSLNDEMKPHFRKLLNHYLSKDKSSWNYFIHSVNNDEFEIALAEHNQAIEKQLTSNGIDVKIAISYPARRFTTEQDPAVQSWLSLTKVEAELITLKSANTDIRLNRQISGILNTINNFRGSLGKADLSEDDAIKALNSTLYKAAPIKNSSKKEVSLLVTQLKTINKNLQALDEPSQVFDEFNQYIKQVAEKAQAIVDGKIEKTTIKKAKSFRVENWDKNQIETLWLGDCVNCCLSLNGEHFDALIERSLDDAMFYHVVIDEETNQPVALNWLFYAQDENGLYVVSNYTEMQGSYSRGPSRDQILANLFDYTCEFTNKIGAKQFIMRELTYGNVYITGNGSFKELDYCDFELEKVGGFFQDKEYYLKALEEDCNLRVVTKEGLKKQFPTVQISPEGTEKKLTETPDNAHCINETQRMRQEVGSSKNHDDENHQERDSYGYK